MKLVKEKLIFYSKTITSNKRYLLTAFISLTIVAISTFKFSNVVLATFASWGDSGLVHACEGPRGQITIVDSTETCGTGETPVTWLKDVDAGTGLSISRSSSGATISLANIGEDGWIDAGETWTYASADDPTFTFTISGDQTDKYSAGMRVSLTQTTEKYFLITDVSYSSPNTTVTLFGGTDYDLANATITNPYFSSQKAPHMFPLDPAKWTIEVNPSSANISSPTVNTWYNPNSTSITVPKGAWRLYYLSDLGFDMSGVGNGNAYITLSTSSSSESDSYMTTKVRDETGIVVISGTAEKYIDISSETEYYLIIKTGYENLVYLYYTPKYIRATSSYL